MSGATKMVDVHHHIVPKQYLDGLTKRGIRKALGVQFPPWNVDKALEVMDENGIATSILSISAPGVYFKESDPDCEFAGEMSRLTNEICAELIAKHPGRFGGFATLPLPDVDKSLEELAYCLDTLRLDGVVLLSNYDGYYLGDERFDRLFAELDRRNAVVFVHPASPPGLEASHLRLPESVVDVCFDTTRTAVSLLVNGVLKRYPRVRFILAHAGGALPYMAARLNVTFSLFETVGGFAGHVASGIGKMASVIPSLKEKMPATLDIFLKVRENVLPEGPDHYLRSFYFDTALSASPHAFASLLTLADTTRVLFGTDYVFATEAAVAPTIRGIEEYNGFTQADRDRIERSNAAGLFPGR